MRNILRSGSVRLWQRRLILSISITVPVGYFTLINLFGDRMPWADVLAPWSGLVSFLAATIAMIYLGDRFFRSTVRGFKNGMF